jgi:hypothetical protein
LPTTNDPTGYAPYSVTAIIAVVLASLFLFVLVLLGGSAFLSGQQLVEPLLLVMPAAVLVLAFAARRQILNSEGTRAGLNLCTFAWWVGVLGGCGYAAYLVGRMVGVQQDTKDAVVAWIDTLKKADPVDTRNADFHKAFQMTLDTGRQQSVEAKTPKDIEAAQKGFMDDTASTIGIARFRQLDLVRLLYRNREFDPKFTFDGLQSWQQDTSGLRAKSAGTLRTPEGEFKLNFDMMRQITDRPTWRVVAPPQGFIGGGRVTRYGEALADMEYTARSLVYNLFLPAWGLQPDRRPSLPSEFFNQPAAAVHEFFPRVLAQGAVLGSVGAAKPEPAGYETTMKSQLFVPLERLDGARDGDPRERFYAAWRAGVVAPPGTILKETPDQAPLITVTEKAVVIRVPVEIQLPKMESSQSAARGAVVLECNDPTFLAKLADLRKAAATDPLADTVSPKVNKDIPWTIRGIESDMRMLVAPKKQQADAPPGMGG